MPGPLVACPSPSVTPATRSWARTAPMSSSSTPPMTCSRSSTGSTTTWPCCRASRNAFASRPRRSPRMRSSGSGATRSPRRRLRVQPVPGRRDCCEPVRCLRRIPSSRAGAAPRRASCGGRGVGCRSDRLRRIRAVKVERIETLFCDAGWRPWIFVKATTDDGLVGWAEITDSHGSPRGLAGIVEDLAPLVAGRDPRAVERIYWDLYRHTRQSPGSVVQKALAGIENVLLDLKGKALDVPVYELFGGPTRDSIQAYWSHCGTTRARAFSVTGTPKLADYDQVAALGREVVERGYRAFKTNIVIPGDEPQVLMPGFGKGGGTAQAVEIAAALDRLLAAFAEGSGGAAAPIVDLNFNLEPEGILRVARALERHELAWLEVDLFDPAALAL